MNYKCKLIGFVFRQSSLLLKTQRIARFSSTGSSNLKETAFEDEENTEYICEAKPERGIPKSWDEFKKMKQLPVDQPENAKLNRVAIVGMPNVGKSTLTNQLVGWRISSVSSKVHTTRANVIGVFNEGETQVEILDTPGLVKEEHCRKFNLEESFLRDPDMSSAVADLILVVSDVSNTRERTKLNPGIMKLLFKHREKPSVLVLNKVDTINVSRKLMQTVDILTEGATVGGIKSKRHIRYHKPRPEEEMEQLFAKTRQKLNLSNQVSDSVIEKPRPDQKGWPYFSRVFMISALNNDGVEDLRDYLLQTAKPNLWKYNEAVVTDQRPEQIVKTIVREKMLDILRDEIPYAVRLRLEAWDYEEPGLLSVAVDLVCMKERYVSIILGPQGSTISAIAQQARQELSNAFHCDVALKLLVKSSSSKK